MDGEGFFSAGFRVIGIEEKPEVPKSNYAGTFESLLRGVLYGSLIVMCGENGWY